MEKTANQTKNDTFLDPKGDRYHEPNYQQILDVTKRHAMFGGVQKPPCLYEVYNPSALLGYENAQFTLYEHRAYAFLLKINHKVNKQPSFDIPYEVIFKDYKSQGAKKVMLKEIKRDLQSRVFTIDERMLSDLSPAERKKFIELVSLNNQTAAEEISFNPFPTVNYFKTHFTVELHRALKYILSEANPTYIKGDWEMLLDFESPYYYNMYWTVRNNQGKDKEVILELDDLRKRLGVGKKYKTYKDLKRRVLDPSEKRFEKSYPEFTYSLVHPKSSTLVRLTFKNGPNEERGETGYKAYPFEETLRKVGVYPGIIKRIHHLVQNEILNKQFGFVWDEEYVVFSIEGYKKQYSEKTSNKQSRPVSAPGAYLAKGLMMGFWLQYVVDMKAKSQPMLEFSEGMQLKKLKSGDILTPAVLNDFKETFELVKENFPSFEAFMESNGCQEASFGLWKII